MVASNHVVLYVQLVKSKHIKHIIHFNSSFTDDDDERLLSLSTPNINSDPQSRLLKHDCIGAAVLIILFFAILFAFSLYET